MNAALIHILRNLAGTLHLLIHQLTRVLDRAPDEPQPEPLPEPGTFAPSPSSEMTASLIRTR